MPTIQERLEAVVGGDITDYESKMSKVTRIADSTGKEMQRFGRRGLALFAGLGAASVKYAAEFGKALGEVETIANRTQEEMAQTREGILAISEDLGKDAAELTRGYYEIISAGIRDAAEANQVLESSVRLSIAGLSDQQTAVDIVTSSLNAYNMEADQSEKVSDVLFGTVRLGKLRLDDLARSLGRVMPIAAQMGISFEELNAAVARLTTVGLSAREASAALRALLVGILRPTDEARNYSEELGIAWNRQGIEAFGLTGIMEQLSEHTEDANFNIGKLVPQVRAMPAALALASNGAAGLRKDLDELEESAGAVEDAFEVQEQRLWRRLESLWTRIKLVLIEIGNTLIPTVTNIAESMSEAAVSAAHWVRSNERLVSGILKWGTAGSAALLILGKMLTSLSAVGKAFIFVRKNIIAAAAAKAKLAGLESVVSALAVVKPITLTITVAVVGFEAGRRVYQMFIKDRQKALQEGQRLRREEYQAEQARRRSADERIRRILEEAGYTRIHEKNARQVLNVYETWAQKGRELEEMLSAVGYSQEEIDKIHHNSTVPQLNELLVSVREIMWAENERYEAVRRNQERLEDLHARERRTINEGADAYRDYYQQLETQLEEYHRALESARDREEDLNRERRRRTEDMRSTMLELETARMDPEARFQKMADEAERAGRMAAEAMELDDIEAAEEYRRRARSLFERLARDRIQTEERAQREVQSLEEETQRLRERIEREIATARERGVEESDRQRVAELTRELESVESQLERQRETAKAAGSEADSMIESVRETFETALEAVERQQESAKKATEAAMEDVENLSTKIKELQAEAKDLHIDLQTETAEDRVKQLREDVGLLRTEIEELETLGERIEAGYVPQEIRQDPEVGRPIGAARHIRDESETTVNINVEGVTDPEEVAKRVERIIDRRFRRRQGN